MSNWIGTTTEPIAIGQAATPADIEVVRGLYTEYAAAIGFKPCFLGFDEELAALPGACVPPDGALLLARTTGEPVGCVAVKPLGNGVAELRRLFVRSKWRGRGLGRALAAAAIEAARRCGHTIVRLETVPGRMAEADALYRSLGFHPIPRYDKADAAIACYEMTLG